MARCLLSCSPVRLCTHENLINPWIMVVCTNSPSHRRLNQWCQKIPYRFGMVGQKQASFSWNNLHTRPQTTPKVMSAWQTHKYGQIKDVIMTDSVRVPNLQRPDEVLVKIHAASVNPLDVKLICGYGSKILNQLRRAQGLMKNGSEFPVIPGRDFSGIVVDAGRQSLFKTGDQVWGAVSAVRPRGSFAEYIVAPASGVSLKPVCLSHSNAAALPYVAVSSWTALVSRAGLRDKTTEGKRILILGGSGGVGSCSVQLMKAWGAEVTTTCSDTAADLVISLGADFVLDYNRPNVLKELEALRGFDVIFDCVGDKPEQYMKLLKKNGKATYVTLVTPFMRNTDQFGVVLGGLKSAIKMGSQNVLSRLEGRNYEWALAQPSTDALQTVSSLVDQGKITPVIETVYPFCEVNLALEKVKKGSNRGKTVIIVAKEE